MKKLKRRCGVLMALVRLLLALVRLHGRGLSSDRLPDGAAKARILRAIDSARKALPLTVALKVLRLSPGRYRAWRRAEKGRGLDDGSSCPKTSPSVLTVLDTSANVRRLVDFYIHEHNQVMPHWAHKGLTPDEVYFGTGAGINERLKVEHARARKGRLKVNQSVTCEICEESENSKAAQGRAA